MPRLNATNSAATTVSVMISVTVKACAYENLDCNEKLRKLVSLFLRCTPQKKPSAMPIVQPHQNKFRVFLLIAQLMVRKLFLGAHLKMPFR